MTFDDPPQPAPPGPLPPPGPGDLPSLQGGPDAETLLRRVHELVANARPMPLSASVMLNRDEVLELLDEAISRLPDELRSARWLLKEREEFLAKASREADEILDAAAVRAERMVQRTEVVRAAEQTARRTVEDARAQARRLRNEAEDYCDQKLASFEIVLDRTIKTVQAGRERLRATPLPAPGADGEQNDSGEDADEEGSGALFDQDEP